MDRSQLAELISACQELIDGIRQGNPQAIQASRQMVWQFVDVGSPQQLANLMGAFRFSAEQIMDAVLAGNEQAIDQAKSLVWRWADEGQPDELVDMLAAIKLLAEKIIKSQGE